MIEEEKHIQPSVNGGDTGPENLSPEQKRTRSGKLRKALTLAGVVIVSTPSPLQPEEGTKQTGDPYHFFKPADRAAMAPQIRAFREMDARNVAIEVQLPSDIERDLVNMVMFAFSSGAAKEISRNDLYHCHVFVPDDLYETKYAPRVYRGTVRSFINGVLNDYSKLLGHTQEHIRTPDEDKRNLMIVRGEKPHAVAARAEPKNDRKILRYQDIGSSPLQLNFVLDADGPVVLPDGRRLKVYVETELLKKIYRKIETGESSADR